MATVVTTAWKTAVTQSQGASSWTGLGNLSASDDTYATVSQSAKGIYFALTNFGFSTTDVPLGAIITGVEFLIERKSATANVISDATIKLWNGGAAYGTNMATTTKYPTTDAQVSYGGSTNTWGADTSNLNESIVRSSGFGVTFSCFSSSGSATVTVDYCALRISYIIPDPRARRVSTSA